MGTTANSTTQYGIYTYQSAIPTSAETPDVKYSFKVRANAEILTLTINGTTNTQPESMDFTALPLYARTGGGKNKFGITTRAVKIKRLVGTSPLQFYLSRTVPWLADTLDATIDSMTPPTVSYQGQTDWVVVGVREEKVGDG
jgi:hypothetical protein